MAIQIYTTEKVNIHITRGDTFSFGIRITGLDQDLDSAYFTAVTKPPLNIQIFQKSLNDGISKVGDGEYVVRVAPEDTAELDIDEYMYDLQLGVNDDVFTPFKGTLYLEWEATANE